MIIIEDPKGSFHVISLLDIIVANMLLRLGNMMIVGDCISRAEYESSLEIIRFENIDVTGRIQWVEVESVVNHSIDTEDCYLGCFLHNTCLLMTGWFTKR